LVSANSLGPRTFGNQISRPPQEIAPNELRGSKIEGGREHHITKGDVIVIPNGIPHQFTAGTGELHYFVCKPTALAETHVSAR